MPGPLHLTASLTQYAEHQLHNYSAQAISWIGSVQLFLTVRTVFRSLMVRPGRQMTNAFVQFFLATIVGQIFDAYGPRILLVVGTILIGLSLILTSVLTEYYQLMISHGVIFGIGSAMLYSPSVSGKSIQPAGILWTLNLVDICSRWSMVRQEARSGLGYRRLRCISGR